ncbi:MAG: hypothetical protein HY774_26690 [Acidobacteria bacterium]|nr:hypothetical protein [Acidobacteriota bacterium]
MTDELVSNEDAIRETISEVSAEVLASKQMMLAQLDLLRRMQRARSTVFDDRRDLVFDVVEDVLHALLDNEETSEEELHILARRRDVSFELLRRMAGDQRVARSHVLRRVLVLNPKLPASAGLRLVGQLYLFDLVFVLTTPALPMEVKTAAENLILQQYAGIALGQKITMARRINGTRLIPHMLNDPSQEVVRAALDNPFLNENIVANAVRKATHSHVVSLIADSPKWSVRKYVKQALLRSRYLSPGRATTLIQTLNTLELRELQADSTVSMPIRTLISQISARLHSKRG